MAPVRLSAGWVELKAAVAPFPARFVSAADAAVRGFIANGIVFSVAGRCGAAVQSEDREALYS